MQRRKIEKILHSIDLVQLLSSQKFCFTTAGGDQLSKCYMHLYVLSFAVGCGGNPTVTYRLRPPTAVPATNRGHVPVLWLGTTPFWGDRCCTAALLRVLQKAYAQQDIPNLLLLLFLSMANCLYLCLCPSAMHEPAIFHMLLPGGIKQWRKQQSLRQCWQVRGVSVGSPQQAQLLLQHSIVVGYTQCHGRYTYHDHSTTIIFLMIRKT